MTATPASRRIHWPAVLTLTRILLVIPVILLTLRETSASAWLAFAAFAIAAATDGLDGFAARRMGLVSDFGKMWDPIADKILVLASMAGLVVVGRFPLAAAVIIVVREVIVTVLRWVSARRGNVFGASIAGKLKTVTQLVAVLLYILPVGTVPARLESTVLGVAVALTIVSGVQYVVRAPVLLRRP